MNRLITVVLVCVVLMICVGRANAGKPKAPGQSGSAVESDLVIGVMSLDPAVIAVRPARTEGGSQPGMKIQWSPAITLKKNTSPAQQLNIAQNVAAYVVEFQGGVLTQDVLGGMLVFIEGEAGWTPIYGQVGYKIENGKIAVWADKNIIDGNNVSCCDDGVMIGTVSGAKMVSLPLSKK